MALSQGIVPEYVNALVRSTEQVNTSHILTLRDLGKDLVSFVRDFNHHLSLINPDIVHVHAAWDFRAALIEYLARRKGYFTVVSPHGELSPESMELNFWKDRLPKILLYQLRMIKHCNMLVLTSNKEMEDMERLRGKRNMALVPHPLTNEMSDEDTRRLIMNAYRKVIDTNYRSRITAEEELLINRCLRASVWEDERNPIIPDDDNTIIDISYRRLYLYAHDQNVTEQFVDGAHKLKIQIPQRLNIDEVPRFNVKENIDNREVKNLTKTINILSRLINEEKKNKTKVKPCEYVKPDLRTYLYAYRLMRFYQYDEDKFAKLVSEQRLTRYIRKLQKRLAALFQLEPGFMPLPPR